MPRFEKLDKIVADLEYYRTHPTIAGYSNYGESIVNVPVSLLDDVIAMLRGGHI